MSYVNDDDIVFDEDMEKCIRRLAMAVVQGVPVPIKFSGLRKLATMGPIGVEILEKCLDVLEGTDKKTRYHPLLDLLLEKRAIAEQCLPAAPKTVPEHMRIMPKWLEGMQITYPQHTCGTKKLKIAGQS